MIDQGNLIDSRQQVIQNRIMIVLRSSQEWKSGKPDKTSWNAVQQICPHHGDALLGGNAHSVKYGEIIHDGSGEPDSA